MNKEDTKSIKYILEEMDPAERIEFERYITQNPDLQIEVESIRRMKSKLNTLPDISPPAHLTDSILSMAAAESKKKHGIRKRYFLSAAVVILGLTTGSLMIQNIFEGERNTSQSSASMSAVGNSAAEQVQPLASELKPWVDRQNVLRLSGFETGSNSDFVNDAGNSFEKLKPIGRFPNQQPFNRSLQLTGSNR